jgi:hypothetical protein
MALGLFAATQLRTTLNRTCLGLLPGANGWAINARARINIPFGTSLTQVAQLPEGAERSLADPYAEEQTPWGIYGVVLAVVVLALVVWQQGWLPKI